MESSGIQLPVQFGTDVKTEKVTTEYGRCLAYRW